MSAPVSAGRPLMPEEEADDAPPELSSSWRAFAVMLGALMGVLIVAWVYDEDHPEVPVAAREGTTAEATPSEARHASTPLTDVLRVHAVASDDTQTFNVAFNVDGWRAKQRTTRGSAPGKTTARAVRAPTLPTDR